MDAIPTSVTIKSSIALRLRHLAGRVHQLGPRPLFELMCEIAGGADPLSRFEVYAGIDPDLVRALGGDQLAPTIFLVRR